MVCLAASLPRMRDWRHNQRRPLLSRCSNPRRQIIKTILLLSLAAASMVLGGCAQPSVVQLSPDTYMVRKEDHGGIFAFNRGHLKSDAIRDANSFAEKQGKVAIPISGKEHPVGVLGDW